MSSIQATFDIPTYIEQGLQNGSYERIGGVVREAESKQIVGWLREAYETGEPLFSEILSLTSISSTLNLSISTMGFAVVLQRLGMIAKQLEAAQELLEAINQKVDLSFYGNFQAALDLAMNAFTMSNPETRKVSATQAINRFLEAKHHYSQLVDTELEAGSQLADKYLWTLSLAYVTEVRCYLELEEIGTAYRRLQEGIGELRPRFRKHIRTLLTANPAAYLHPSLQGQIDLRRLTKVYQWLTPGVDACQVFEELRSGLFDLAAQSKEWEESLPQAILASTEEGQSRGTIAKRTTRITGLISNIPRRLSGKRSSASETEPEESPIEIFNLLPETLDLIELMMETDNRLKMYRTEIDTIGRMRMSFKEWQALAPPAKTKDAQLIYISLSG